jgi:methylmalonyl-CoA mutase cobalamin-binding domain/chain
MSESGEPIQPVYRPEALQGFDPDRDLGEPGGFPFTRGVYPTMYVSRPWTMRQYAGFSTAADSNRRYHQLIAAGTTGLSVAFDLPTQMGFDSDAPQARGEVGKVGVAIDSIDDMRVLLHDIPLGEVSTSMTINAPAAVLLLLYQLVAQEQGTSADALTGTIQNDILKEYIARGTYIYPPAPSLRLVADTFAYCRREIPRWNTISISGYHMAEAGATPAQEIAFTLANAKEYVRSAIAAGLNVDDFGPRLSFFFVARTTLLEEVAKFRAARFLWARIMRDEFGAADPRSQMLRFHTQTAGVQLTAQQPEVNLARVTIQALAAVLGGTQSLHTNAYDEAIALPSEKAARERERPDRDGRPARWLLRHRVADQRPGRPGRRPDRPGRGHGRGRRRHRAGLPEGRDRAFGVPDRPADRRRGAGRGRGEQVRVRRRRAVSAAAGGPGGRARAGRAAGGAARGAGCRTGQPPARRRAEGSARQRQRAVPAARGAASAGHGRRGV